MIMGIDNGTSGSICVIDENTCKLVLHTPTPIKQTINYTKEIQKIKRIDPIKLDQIVKQYMPIRAILERPMVNPTRFKTSLLAVRALEATLNVLELNNIPYEIIDSKEWQKHYIPHGTKKDDLKFVADQKACQLFGLSTVKSGLGDSILLTKYLYDKMKGNIK